MKLTTNPRMRLRGQVVAAWLLVVFFLIFVVIIFGVAYTCIKTIKRIVPPPPPDDKGWVPGIGDKYQGGIVTAYVPPPHATDDASPTYPPGFEVKEVRIFSSDRAYPGNDWPHWTNMIWNGPLDQVTNQMSSNGIPMELWPQGQQPDRRFYNIVYVIGPQ